MGGSNPPQPKNSEQAKVPVTEGLPLEQREIRPRKDDERIKPFTASEAAIMVASNADLIALEVELAMKTEGTRDGDLINPIVERQGKKVLEKLVKSLEPDATPEQLLVASNGYVERLEKMIEAGLVEPLHQKNHERELLAAKSAKRRLDDMVYAIGLAGRDRDDLGEQYNRLIDAHKGRVGKVVDVRAELEKIREQSKSQQQAPVLTQSETEIPLRDRPMTDKEVAEQRETVARLFEGRKEKKEMPTLVPEDSSERRKFAKEFFGETQSPEALVIPVTPENVAVFRDYFLKELRMNGRMAQAANGRMKGNLAGILGGQFRHPDGRTTEQPAESKGMYFQLGPEIPSGGPKRFAYDIVRSKATGRDISLEALEKMSAKQFAKEYLDVDVNQVIPDYDKIFI